MGQKVHPIGIRLGIVKEHNSLWYAGQKTYSDCLVSPRFRAVAATLLRGLP